MTAAQPPRATRGHGLLESFLARKRHARARALLRPLGCIDRVLDIGCGTYPYQLAEMPAADRVGIDRILDAQTVETCARDGIRLIAHDVARDPALPFDDARFDAVTMLAVVEHLELETAKPLVREVHRVLRPGGVFVATTPAAWTDGILRAMARLSLVSPEEIDEHGTLFTRASLAALLHDGGFDDGHVETGAFEWGMNLWARAVK